MQFFDRNSVHFDNYIAALIEKKKQFVFALFQFELQYGIVKLKIKSTIQN